MKTPAPHVHAKAIHAYADGYPIQVFSTSLNKWIDDPSPTFTSGYDYRVKPIISQGYRIYLYNSDYSKVPALGFVFKGGYITPKQVENTRQFIRWISDDWQYFEYSVD